MDPDAAWGRIARFSELVSGDARHVALDQSALAMASVLRARTDITGGLAALDELAAGCPDRTFESLCQYLFGDAGFRGHRQHYDDPRNSFLDIVLDRRSGLPILLATVVMEVGRRIDVPVLGIGMPMHFLVRSAGDADRFADPFAGEVLDRAGVRRLFEAMSEERLPWNERYLEPVDARAIVSRMLANLFASYRRRRDPVGLALVARMRAAIPELASEAPAAVRLGAVFN
jgi:regulator of sirC expression with transglutaminase-like and TPR domain